jgi:hypothetical protein
MNSPPDVGPSNAGNPAPPTVEVRLEGRLFRRISALDADKLVGHGWAEWRGGAGRRCYLELSAEAPISSLFGMRGRTGTRPMRAGGAVRDGRAAGQLLGEPRSHLEHIPPTA